MADLGTLNVLIQMKGISTFKRQLKDVSGDLSDTGKTGSKAFDSMQQPIQRTRKEVDTFGESIKGFNRGLRDMSSGLRAVQQAAQFVAVSIAGPLTLALAEASKRDRELHLALEDVKKTSNEFMVSVGSSLLPIVRQVGEGIRKLVDEWNKLPKAQRDSVIQTLAWTAGIAAAIAISARFLRALIGLARIMATPGGVVFLGLSGILAVSIALVNAWDKLTGKASSMASVSARAAKVGAGLMNPAQGMMRGAVAAGQAVAEKFLPKKQDTLQVGLGTITGTARAPNAFVQASRGARQALADLKSEVDRVFGEMMTQLPTLALTIAQAMKMTFEGFAASFGQAIGQSIVFGKNFEETFKNLIKNVAAEVISFLASTIAKIVLLRALGVIGPIWAGAIGLGGGGGGGGGGGNEPSGATGKKGLFGLGFLGLQHGGIVKKPTMAMIGESGPEAVIPLNQAGGINGGITINFTEPIFLDDEASKDRFIRRFTDSLKRISNRRTGGTALAF